MSPLLFKHVAGATIGDRSDPSRILAGLLCPVGDTLLATPALHALRLRFPDAHITALTYASNSGILKGNPSIDEILVLNPPGSGRDWLQAWRTIWQVRRRGFDLLVNFAPLSQILGPFGHIRRRVSSPRPRLWWLLPRQDPAFVRQHAIEHYLNTVRQLGTPEVAPYPRIYLSASDRQAAYHLFQEASITASDLKIVIHPGAKGLGGRKRWSAARFTALAAQLQTQNHARIVLIGSIDELPLSQEIAKRLPQPPLIATGRLTLRQTAALIQRCDLLIGNDSSPLHIAAAVGTPTIGIYGPSNPAHFHPVGENHRHVSIQSVLPCSPCFHFIGSEPIWQRNLCHTYRCLKQITVADVMVAAQSLIAELWKRPTASGGCARE
jgi:lipopolysaccharide heptosyltransferase II